MPNADAAKTTAALIERGADSAGRGVALNGEVLESLTEINAQVERVVISAPSPDPIVRDEHKAEMAAKKKGHH